MKTTLHITLILTLTAITGCGASFGERAKFGMTFYCPGAGNVDMGDAGIREGLRQAGYRGQVARLTWSVSFNPAIDQTVRIFARQGGKRLATYIQDYVDQFPDREVNVVGLSAGSGVAIWALESLKPGYKVNNVILLSSSLHHRYDVSRALRNVKGKIYCYYSPNDAVLTSLMKAFGTIDGVFLEDGAGAVGLHSPGGAERIVNIRWQESFEKYGYYGGHTDVTSPAFVQHHISRHIVKPDGAVLPETGPANRVAQVRQGVHQD